MIYICMGTCISSVSNSVLADGLELWKEDTPTQENKSSLVVFSASKKYSASMTTQKGHSLPVQSSQSPMWLMNGIAPCPRTEDDASWRVAQNLTTPIDITSQSGRTTVLAPLFLFLSFSFSSFMLFDYFFHGWAWTPPQGKPLLSAGSNHGADSNDPKAQT